MNSTWLGRFRAHVGALRFDIAEASGALGDLGLFIPIVVSLVSVCDMDIGSVLLFAGLWNIVIGLAFNQPIPVQPMKAIAAVAIAESLSPGAIVAAGLGTGVIVFILGVTGLVDIMERLIPRAIVRGVQLGVGLKLLAKGFSMTSDGWLVAVAAAAFVILSSRWRRFPSAIILFGAGLGLMLVTSPNVAEGLELGWSGLGWNWPSALEWRVGLVRGTLPQMPLTLLNSVIAVCALSGDLYPGRGIKTRPVAISVGLMNMVSCGFGAMPMCFGAGGLAAQHRFGGRTGGCMVMLGVAKIGIGIGLGSTAAVLLAAFPASILGVFLCFAGVELSLPARDCVGRDDFFLAILTAGGILSFNAAIGCAVGLLAALLLSAARYGRTPEDD